MAERSMYSERYSGPMGMPFVYSIDGERPVGGSVRGSDSCECATALLRCFS